VKEKNFVDSWYINKKVCNSVIDYFEKSDQQTDGVCNYKGVTLVNKKVKSCVEISVSVFDKSPEIVNYLIQLNKVLHKYKQKYIYCHKKQDSWSICEYFNIQKYQPKESFSAWHCERNGPKNGLRFLSFMTYLNDIKKGGETEWYYQKLKVKPEQGKTIIWPAEWTHTHRGIAAPKETKYIVTGWYGYIPQ
jgi:hypothetical protein|tara:strand:- start:2377 stop:2949 length:573 start_codon:yes stop_codon:yes gene_type:complete